MNSLEDYWAEGLSESLEEHGVTASTEQIRSIAKDVVLFSEHTGQAFYVPEDPLIREVELLKKELEREKAKITCRACNGTGQEVSHGVFHSAYSVCWKCNGDGRHAP